MASADRFSPSGDLAALLIWSVVFMGDSFLSWDLKKSRKRLKGDGVFPAPLWVACSSWIWRRPSKLPWCTKALAEQGSLVDQIATSAIDETCPWLEQAE